MASLEGASYDEVMHSWHRNGGTVFVTAGTGYGKTALSAFDAAELNAKILATNAIRVTSFVPPGWTIVRDGTALAAASGDGAFLPMAYQYAVSHTERVAACLMIGVNADHHRASIVMEHAETGIDPQTLRSTAKESVEEVFHARGWKIADFVVADAYGEPRDGLFVCALVAAIYVPR